MLTIPLSTALLLYALFLVIIAIFTLVNLHHLAVNASLTLASFVATVAVFSLGTLTLFGTWSLLQDTDWQTPILSFDTGVFQSDTLPTL